MNAGLGGTGRAADDLYLMAHDDRTGRALLRSRQLGIGLAGGLLAELMLGEGIALRHDGAIVAHRTQPGDDLARHVHAQITAEREPLPIREWLLFLAQAAAGAVARRLEQEGYLRRVRSGVPWRSGRWVPVNPDWAYAPMSRVSSALSPGRPCAAHEAAVAGLAVACGLGFRLEQVLSSDPGTSHGVEEAVSWLKPALRELIAQTQVAVDSAVLSHRT